MSPYPGRIAARAAGINRESGVQVRPLHSTVFPLSTPFHAPPEGFPSAGETSEAAFPALPPLGNPALETDSYLAGSILSDAAPKVMPEPEARGTKIKDLPPLTQDAAPPGKSSLRPPIYPGTPKKEVRPAEKPAEVPPVPEKPAGARPTPRVSRTPMDKKSEVRLNPAQPVKPSAGQEEPPVVSRRRPNASEDAAADEVPTPGVDAPSIKEPLRSIVRIEPAIWEEPPLPEMETASGTSVPSWAFEAGRLTEIPRPQWVPFSARRGEVRVTIGQVEVRVESVKPQTSPPKAAQNQPDPFASLTFARRGWRTIF